MIPTFGLHIDQVAARGALRRITAPLAADGWLCVILSPRGERAGHVIAAEEVAGALADDAIAIVLSPADRRAGLASLPALVALMPGGTDGLVVLVARRAPPVREFRYDGQVTSFACSARVLRLHAAGLGHPDVLCFRVLHAVLAGQPAVERLVVRQIPLRPEAIAPPPRATGVTVVLPHRGAPALLASALRGLAVGRDRARVLVGLDHRGAGAFRTLGRQFPDVALLHSAPAPIGPYAIRHALARRARTPCLMFHDSDDVSCWDRIAGLAHAMQRTGAAMVGSHELRLDELHHCVTATRFPLDPGAALRRGAQHPMLFPATLIRRASYFAIGGVSTDRAFAYDTQLVLRASFALALANADDFLYIRRKRAGSLTTAPATALGTPIRVALMTRWMHDFGEVAAGRLALAASSLRVMARRAPYRLVPVTSPVTSGAARSGRSR